MKDARSCPREPEAADTCVDARAAAEADAEHSNPRGVQLGSVLDRIDDGVTQLGGWA